jgi:Transposase
LRLRYKFFAETSCLHDCIKIRRIEVMTQEQVIPDEEPQWAAFIAIDWADREHIWKLQEAESGAYEQRKLEQTPEAIEAWASHLATRFDGRPIAVALEQSRGAVVFALTKYCHLHLYPVHPSTLAHFRQAMVPSGSKTIPATPACCWSCCCITGFGSAD